MHEKEPLVIKYSDEHLGNTIERKNTYNVKSTIVDADDNGRWHEEVVLADDEEKAEKWYRLACEEFGFEIVGNMDVSTSEDIKISA